MNNLKITIVTGPFYPLPPGPAGSLEKIWLRLAGEFAEHGHDVTLVSKAEKQFPTAESKGFRVLGKAGFGRTGLRIADLLLEAIYGINVARSLPKSDVIVTNTIFLPILLPLMKRRVGRAVVCVERFPKGQLWCYSKCARLRTTSKAVHHAVVEQCPSLENKLKRIPNPVDTSVFAPPKQARGSAQAGTIVFTGRIHPEKGLDILVRAFRIVHQKYPETKLTLAGPQETAKGGGGPDYIAAIHRLAEGLPVAVLPNISNPADLAQLLRKSDIFCYPSVAEKGESFPVAPLEAMASGLPMVLSRLPVFEDIIEEGQTGITFDYKAQSPHEDLAAKLLQVIENDKLRAALSREGAALANTYCYERVAKAFLNDFNALTGNISKN